MDEAPYRQIEAASSPQSLTFIGEFNHPNMLWKENRRGQKQSRRFLEINDPHPIRRGALLDLILRNQEGLVGDVKVESSLCCSVHEMVKSRMLKAGRKMKSNLTTPEFRRANTPAERSFWKSPRDKALEETRAQESCLIIQEHFLQAQKWSIPTNK